MQRNHKNLLKPCFFPCFFFCNTRQNKGHRKDHHHSHWWCLDTWDKMAALKTQNCAAALSDFHLSTTSLCQSGIIAPSKLHLPPKLRGTEVANWKKENLTAFSTAGWLFRNNLAGVCWLCLRSADSCRAWLPFSLWDKCFPSTSTVFAVLNSSLRIFIRVTFFSTFGTGRFFCLLFFQELNVQNNPSTSTPDKDSDVSVGYVFLTSRQSPKFGKQITWF